jgi:hypothetical protein
MNYKGRAVKLKARTADGVKSRQSIAIAVDGIEGVVKIEELWKSKIRGGGAIVVLTGLRAGRLGRRRGQDRDRCSEVLNVRDQVSGRLGAQFLAV